MISTLLFGIALVLVLLSFENMTNTNTILNYGIVFQYNTSRIVHLCNKQGQIDTIMDDMEVQTEPNFDGQYDE